MKPPYSMANGLDRLEKFFLKRKTSAISHTSDSDAVSTPRTPAPFAPGDIPRFPSPSFIRPKGSRMAARQEVVTKQPTSKTCSNPDISDGVVAIQQRKPSEYDGLQQHKLFTMRSMSALDKYEPFIEADVQCQRTPSLMADALGAIQFPVPKRHSKITQRHVNPTSSSPSRVIIPPPEISTPPSSDSEADLRRAFMKKKLPPVPIKVPPTPEHSPLFGPSLPSSRNYGQIPLNDGFQHLPSTPSIPERSLGPSLMSRSNSDASATTHSLSGSTLKEPELSDFLDLTDEDIAEDPVVPMLLAPVDQEPQLPSMSLAVAQSRSRASRLLTLSPPRSTQAATAAAFEAARIANRYDFDLIYVVNLWPENPPTRGGSSSASHKPMVGRLLAAFGLQNLSSPLQISSAIHTSILRSQGWIEYRNPAASRCDLSRGYACSFYPGEFHTSSKGHRASPISGVKLSERIDRGIVFAAYRRPRRGSQKMGYSLKRADLGKLHNEAEALVEMLIDIHTMNRLRCSTRRSHRSDESFIGPIPTPQVRIV